jgi:uncharacterized protein (TIGR03435 family)
MLQALLETRFGLRVHRETREVPVLELVIAKGGTKVRPFTPGTCIPYDASLAVQPPLESGQRRCLTHGERGTNNTWLEVVDAETLDDWVRQFDDRSALAGRPPIVNRTGLTGLQTFQFEYSGSLDQLPVELRRELGLDLRPGRARRDFFVLDRVERPSLDAPSDASVPTDRSDR